MTINRNNPKTTAVDLNCKVNYYCRVFNINKTCLFPDRPHYKSKTRGIEHCSNSPGCNTGSAGKYEETNNWCVIKLSLLRTANTGNLLLMMLVLHLVYQVYTVSSTSIINIYW